ncbi:hypothetical protein K438DRAFT_1859985 [Mycena galopus ATCC 62051]|nr:hypothetical protein K438DRAFT_1859985 [Mycena galopus ATCC 62051]
MSPYSAEFHSPPQPMTSVLVEWLSKYDVKQARVAAPHSLNEYAPSFPYSPSFLGLCCLC